MPSDFHKKPTTRQRSVEDALARADRDKVSLPQTIQVSASDWDRVILADEIKKLRKKVAR